MIKDEISIIGTYSVTPYEFPEALDLLEKRKLNTDEMITHVFPLDKLSEAIDLSTDPKQSVLNLIIKSEI